HQDSRRRTSQRRCRRPHVERWIWRHTPEAAAGPRRVNPAGTRDSGFGIRDAGDSALLLELEPVIDPVVNARAIGIAAAIAAHQLAGVRDVIPTYRSVAVHFDPLAADAAELRGALLRAANAAPATQRSSLIEVP